MQMPVPALEVRRPLQAEAARGHAILLFCEKTAHLVAIPHIELAFLVLAICIERGVVTAFGRLHLPHDPRRGLFGAALVERILCHEPRVSEQGEQRPVVVQHFLEVGDHPLRIDAVAAKAAAELIVDAALAHAP